MPSLGYALMLYVWNDWYTEAIPIMRWLQTMRNVDGGFGSTQVRDALILMIYHSI